MEKLFRIYVILGLILVSLPSFGQKADSVARKNVIKYNLTSPAIYSRAFLFQYERIINPNRSIAVQFGHVALPELLKRFENVQKIANAEQFGYNVTVDYRFYLAKENKYNAPRGIYISPFVSIHNFKNIKNFEFQTEDGGEFVPVNLNTKMNILSAGVALGYQFVVWDRMTLDFLMVGPSLSNYNINMVMDGDIPIEELEENLQQIIEILADRFPLFNTIMQENIAEFTGRTNTSSIGFRYSVSIGFRF